MPEILGDAGQYFNPLNPNEMADAIVRIILEPGLAESLSERGIRQVKQFSWRRSAKLTANVLVAVASYAELPDTT